MARKCKKTVSVLRPRLVLKDKALQVGCRLGSLGDIEQLAGVNIQSEAERHALWWQFHHLFNGPTRELLDAVMDHCAELALRRIQAGELCLVTTRYFGPDGKRLLADSERVERAGDQLVTVPLN